MGHRPTRHSLAVTAILALLVSGHALTKDNQPALIAEVASALANAQRSASSDSPERARLVVLQNIYAQRGFAPLWLHDDLATREAIQLLHVLQTSKTYGLPSEDYAAALAWQPLLSSGEQAASRTRLGADFEVTLSATALRFLNDVHFGRVDPRRAGFNLDVKRPSLDAGSLLSQLATSSDTERVIAQIEPQFYHYQLLKQALQRYRQLASGQATATPAELLTVPFERRVRQIELTLERWRWLPALDSPPIIVNIPQFRLFAFQSTRDRKAEILQMDVIVGRTYPKLQTPVFTADMKYVIFRPYWDVPYSITQRELLPQIRAHPDYLRQQHLEMVRGPGDSAPVVPFSAASLTDLASGKLRLRQQPGGDNALGLIKFMLPNIYNVYLHSTPAHKLFSRARRTFSHGCIRVSDPVALATYVLRDSNGTWTTDSITAAMNGSSSIRVNLIRPIHVLILYGTALATEDGPVMFFDDIYGHDRKLEALLAQPNAAKRAQ